MPAKVTFLIGRGGTGKTREIEHRLCACMQAGRKAVVLVPEQFTFEAERAFSARLGGLLGIQILSFTRLSERVLGTAERPFLSAQGRRMALRRAAYRCRTGLTAFAPVALRPGFAERMDQLFALCKRFLITPEALSQAAAALPDAAPLRGKLQDMALLFGQTQAFLDERYLDEEDAFTALHEALPASFLAGATVFVDGFDLMTAQLFALFGRLMQVADSVTFAIAMDPDPMAADAAVFAPERRAYERLMETAASLGSAVFTRAFHTTPALAPMAYLAGNLFAADTRPYPDSAPEITVYAAQSRAAEAEAVADAVLCLAREGVRYRDMAVIAGDMPAYAALVQRAFALREIPLFLDARRSIEGHPATELLLCAARAASQGFLSVYLLRICKTGLAGVEKDEAEAFENYVLRYGLKGGSVFTAPFTLGQTPPLAEDARAKLMPPLMALKEGLKAKDAAGKARALYGYLESLSVCEQLTSMAESLRSEGRYALMEEHAQVWNVLVELLDQLNAILGESPVTKAEFLSVLEDAAAAYQVGIIPATADQVLLGTITRTRSRPVRALFVLGCNEGVLPGTHLDDGIIDDGELSALSGLGLAPWGDSKRRAENDAFDIYRAFSRASERLWVGYACASGKDELIPSFLIKRIRELFPQCREAGDFMGVTALPESAQGGFQTLIDALSAGREDMPLTKALLRFYGESPAYRERLQTLLRYRNAPASPPPFGRALAGALYGRSLRTSASQAESFHTCPFRHFMQYGLKARPRQEFRERLSRLDTGAFCHMALEAFVKAVGDRDWAALTAKDVNEVLDDVLPKCLAAFEEGLLVSTPRASAVAGLWLDVVRHTAHAVARQLGAGRFKPLLTELHFGPHELFPPIRLALGDGREAILSGVIDRLDGAKTDDGQGILQVVDYKTGNASLELAEVLAGVRLQLPLYLSAAEEAIKSPTVCRALGFPGAEAGGMFYQPVALPAAKDSLEQALLTLRLDGLVAQRPETLAALERDPGMYSAVVNSLKHTKDGPTGDALISPNGLKRLMRFAKRRAGEALIMALEGEAAASPLALGQAGTACSFCDYKSVCRFESRLPGCRVRPLSKVNQAEFLAYLAEGEQE